MPPKSPHPRAARYNPPPARPMSFQQPPQLISPWRSWDSLAIILNKLPKEANTHMIWEAFNKYGSIFSIDVFEDAHGNVESRGKIRFKPPPDTDFWTKHSHPITLPNGKVHYISIFLDESRADSKIPSPTRPDVQYRSEVRIPVVNMDIGVMLDATTMLPMRTVTSNRPTPLAIDLRSKALWIYFEHKIKYPTSKHKSDFLLQNYRIKIPLVQLSRIFQTRDKITGRTSHFVLLESPAIYQRRLNNIGATFVDPISWRDNDAWFRQTYILHNPHQIAPLPVSLRKAKPVIDIGRWNALKITYPGDVDKKGDFTLLCNILNDYNVHIINTDRFTQWEDANEKPPQIWQWIDLTDLRSSAETSTALEDLIDHNYIHLPFAVRYQLEVCISNGYLPEFSVPREFATKLANLGEEPAKKLLEHVATQKRVYYDPMEIFNLKFIKGATAAKLPSYCCYMRSARVTPSTVYYETPSMDMSNRVIRHYIEYVDRFLRVRFTDERLFGRIHSTADNTMDEVFTRIKRTLANGIVIGDRHYQFLAFGNSQFREHGAYFFAPLPNLTAANIRAWMGHFDNIRNVAKHAARLGQCFSTTRAIVSCSVDVVKIEDIVRNGYTFSDGVGRISKFLAQMIMSELKIKTAAGDPPSAFQFRLGGCKGILTVSPKAQRREVHIRASQNKFTASHNGLEIIRWSQFTVASLNRQLIIVLSTLGIQDKVFMQKLEIVKRGLDEMLENDARAISLLRKYVDPNQVSLTVSQMVVDGFRRSKEPFVTSLLSLWRAWQMKYLKDKAKIAIDKGACVLGCVDETGILKGHFHDKIPGKDASLEQKMSALPEIFIQVPNAENGGKYEVVQGVCILARNPSLHSGDIRVVHAVDVPELRYLQDVVVLPQTGDRDLASMCSGGDLDGDDYVVIWDQDLIPNDWFGTPMDYTSNKARDLDHEVTVDEITSFFVTYMKNDCLPQIAHAHLAWADRLDNGVNEEKCIRLAQLHSDAVDYNKNGTPAIMTRNLEPRMWPHFMEKRNKDREYRSGKILGQLYNAVEKVDFSPNLGMPFDERILKSKIPVDEELYQFAKVTKQEYDIAIRRIMAQHDIQTEFEVWSTFVIAHANMSKDYKFHEDIGMLSSSLREGSKKLCYAKVGGRDYGRVAPLALAMYRVTHEEMTAALEKYRREYPSTIANSTPKLDQLPFISFPWLFPHVLGRIAVSYFDDPELPPLDALKDDAEQATDDPFGFFEGDEKPSISASVNMVNSDGDHRINGEAIDSLEELLGFGLSRMSISPALAGEVSLLEFDEPEQQCDLLEEVEEAEEDTKEEAKEQAAEQAGVEEDPKQQCDLLEDIEDDTQEVPEQHAAEQVGVEEPKQKCDILEEAEIEEPNALDRLYELLEMDET